MIEKRAIVVSVIVVFLLSLPLVFGLETACNDQSDNDNDGAIDCEDSDCESNKICVIAQLEDDCSNNDDDDSNSLIDCADEDCDGEVADSENHLCEYDTELTCNDGFDNDRDSLIDCLDSDCDGLAGDAESNNCEYQIEKTCDDGFDNDRNLVCFVNSDCPTDYICNPEGNCVEPDYENLQPLNSDGTLAVTKSTISKTLATPTKTTASFVGQAIAPAEATEIGSEETATAPETVSEQPSFFSRLWRSIKNLFGRTEAVAGQATYYGDVSTKKGVDCSDSDCVQARALGPDGQICCQNDNNCVVDACGPNYECLNCNGLTKYSLNYDNTKLCNGQRWLKCSDLTRNPIIDPTVQVSCTNNIFTVREIACNNGLDDDYDTEVDLYDADCGMSQISNLGNDYYYSIRLRSNGGIIRHLI